MITAFDNIVQHLFHQPSLQSVTVGELERVVEQHPSFAAAQFLLLKKMQDTSHPGFTSQLQKTTLYFNNPLWLQFLLQPIKEKEAPAAKKEEQTAGLKEEHQELVSSPAITGEFVHQNAGHIETAVAISNNPIAEQSVFTVAVPELPSMDSTTAIAEEYSHSQIAETPGAEHKTAGTLYEPISAIALAEEYNYHSQVIQQEQTTESQPEEIKETADAITVHETVQVQEQDPTEHKEQNPEAEAAPAEVKKEEPVLLRTIIETPAAKEDRLFEPYHTIDYFASQGIKLSKIEPEPKDRFGKQLKSFTEWLKGMKKLPQASVDKILAENEESDVMADASHSIESKEVITEAMAEVFEKQGLYAKAVGVYHKLSLQNPSKSAYFASRIEALNQQ